MKDYLLFDLDGTLTDPKIGICTCVQYALRSFGIEEPDLDKLEPFIGPPLADSFMHFYGMSEEDAWKAVEKYRERFRDRGIFENEIYRGIPRMLRKLRAEGFHLAVASSKPTIYVQQILEHFHIAQYFHVVVGSEMDGSRAKKSEVVEEALRQLFATEQRTHRDQIQKDRVYMIGDTKFDVEGAAECGVESVGVAYGYGGMEELMAAHADYIVRSVEELQSFLLRTVREQRTVPSPLQWWGGLILPLLLFLVIRALVTVGCGLLLFMDPPIVPKGIMDVMVFGEGADIQFTANGAVVINMLAFLCAAIAIGGSAREEIEQAWEDTKLSHLRAEPASRYLLLSGAALGSVIGVNLLFSLTGLVEASERYNAFARSNGQISLWLGLIAYGIVSPGAEELLFRGLLYNRLRLPARLCPGEARNQAATLQGTFLSRTLPAILISAALFGFYHMNIVQGIYAFVIGCLMAYGYEYFGSFLVPVFLHAGANMLAWLVPLDILVNRRTAGWMVCVCALLLAAGSLFVLKKGK